MKKMKFVVVMAAFAASLGITSCLDTSSSGGTGTLTWPFKVDYDIMTGKTIFVDEADNEYIPTTTVTVSGERSDLAMVSFSYDYEQFAAQGDRKDITVLGTPEYLPKGEVSDEAIPEEGTVSLSGFNTQSLLIWGYNDYLILNPLFYVHKSTTNETLDTELKNHKFTLYYDAATKAENDVMKLKLRYQILNVETEDALADYTVSYSYCYEYFDLRSAIRAYETLNGTYPKKLEVEYETASTYVPTMDSKKKSKQTYVCEMRAQEQAE